MKQALLVVQISETSLDEVFLIDRIAQQLQEDYQIIAFVNGISSAYVQSQPEYIVKVLTENQDENYQHFQLIMEKSPVKGILILDLYNYYLRIHDLNFLPLWLKDIQQPIFALDYFNLLQIQGGQVLLNENVQLDHYDLGEEPQKLELSLELIKPVLPILPEQNQNQEQTHHWQAIDINMPLSQAQYREEVLNSLKGHDSDKIVTIYYDPVMFSMAMERALMAYYLVSVEIFIFYLRKFLGQKFHLLVVGTIPPTEQTNEIPDLNVNVHFFTHLTHDNYRTLLGASDLIVSNTNWHPVLLDAMVLGTPSVVMGNSVILDWVDETETEKQLKAHFQSDPALYRLCEIWQEINRWSLGLPIYPYINYPQRYQEVDFPEPGLQEHPFPYFLLDTFDDETSAPILQKLLFSEQYRQSYRAFCSKLIDVSKKQANFQDIWNTIQS